MSISRKDRVNHGKGTFEIKFQDADQEQAVFEQVFLGVGSEELTDLLIAELSYRGWPMAALKGYQKQGYRYSRVRDSIIEGRVNKI